MFPVAISRKELAGAAIFIAFLAVGWSASAHSDPCVQQCRAQHNDCRMATKLLSSPRCDAQLQSCISRCFAAHRERPAMRGQPHERGGPPRGPR
ncbi:hypothetical protein DLM45_11640 [Hyphomicrobium methylovorum]|nr:hypothetical protein [Hyphomicrobium methylovorum]